MAVNENNPDADAEQGRIAWIENFLRPLEKQDRETLDRMFAKAQECIAADKEIAEKMRQQNASTESSG